MMVIQCLICDSKIGERICDISSHVKKHNITLLEYLYKNYTLIGGKIEKCSFCENDAKPILNIKHESKEYSLSYDGYLCGVQECKNKISLEILGIEYESKKYEKIGSKKEYLSKLYRIDIDVAKSMKYAPPKEKFNCKLEQFQRKYGDIEGEIKYNKRIDGIIKNHVVNKFPCTLENFIKRYGEDLGTKKYNDRCEKISYSSSIDFFIEKYGYETGNEIWKNKFRQIKTSKSSLLINKLLTELNIRFEMEKNINGKFVDYYLIDYDICIEYFGNYWHMNPKLYEADEYNKRLKKFAKEKWNEDFIRLEKIREKCQSIIIVWESTKIDITLLEKTINNIKGKKIKINL